MLSWKSHDLLEVGEDDEADDQGHNGQAVTHHGQVEETDGELHRQQNGLFINIYLYLNIYELATY